MEQRISPREQGDIGELSAADWLVRHGAKVYLPLGHSPDVDMIADFGGRLVRVQVKTSTVRLANDRFQVRLSTSGGNQSWSRVIKRFTQDRCDALFVLVADGRRWYIPVHEIDAGSAIIVGGPKFASFEVERGDPFTVLKAA